VRDKHGKVLFSSVAKPRFYIEGPSQGAETMESGASGGRAAQALTYHAKSVKSF
jgi:hypothetical protein